MAKGKKSDWWNRRSDLTTGSPIKNTEVITPVTAFDFKLSDGSPSLNAQSFYGQRSRRTVVFTEGCEPMPDKVYRFFKDPVHADDFVRGRIQISTLKKCREYEDSKQGDKLEGHEIFHIDDVKGDGDDPEFVENMNRADVFISKDSKNIRFKNYQRKLVISDAYILCTTLGFTGEDLGESFGNYCVEINDVDRFFSLLSYAMLAQLDIEGGGCGAVIYKDQTYRYGEQPPGPIGFVKRPDEYSSQAEFRFLWSAPEGVPITVTIINVPGIDRFCKRIV